MDLAVKEGDVLAVYNSRSKRPVRVERVVKIRQAFCATAEGNSWSLRDSGLYPRKDRLSWSQERVRVATPEDLSMWLADTARGCLSRFLLTASDAEVVALVAHLPARSEVSGA